MNDTSNNIAATLLRASFGIILIAHALLKVLVFTMPGTVGFFASQGFPGWLAYPVVAIEFFGGVALVLGIQTRLVALASLPVMLGALTVHLGNGWVFNAPNGGWEYPALLAVLSVVVALQAKAGVAIAQLGRAGSRSQAA
ncbi:MAG: DoxX family protein [Pseudomonadota bacterium]